jgi:hypothetical protein
MRLRLRCDFSSRRMGKNARGNPPSLQRCPLGFELKQWVARCLLSETDLSDSIGPSAFGQVVHTNLAKTGICIKTVVLD